MVAYDGPPHGRSTGRFASLIEFARALRAVADARGTGTREWWATHSVGPPAVLALRDGLAVERVGPARGAGGRHPVHDDLRRSSAHPAEGAGSDAAEPRGSGSTRAGTSSTSPPSSRKFRTAALLIHDRGDPDVPFRNAQEIAAAWPGARVLATDGLGHRALLRDPTVVRSAVAFLAKAAAR